MDKELDEVVKEFYKLDYDKILNHKDNFIALGEDKNILIDKRDGKYCCYSTSGETRYLTLKEHILVHRVLYLFGLLNYE